MCSKLLTVCLGFEVRYGTNDMLDILTTKATRIAPHDN